MKKILTFFIILLLIGTATAKMDNVMIGSNVLKEEDSTSFIFKTLQIEPYFIREYTAAPNTDISMTYTICAFLGTSYYQTQSRVVAYLEKTPYVDGVPVIEDIKYDTGTQSVSAGNCYPPVTFTFKTPTTPGKYWGKLWEYMTMNSGNAISKYPFTINVVQSTVPTTISVSPTSSTIEVLKTQQLSATIKDQSGGTMVVTPTWSSANTNIASVDANGLVTGKGLGSTTITASYSGLSAISSVKVIAPGVVISPPTGFAAFLAAIWAFLRSIFPFLPG